MNNTITSEQFLKLKKQQQVELWEQGRLSTAQLVDWILGYGDDEDVEWLCANFDPEETITKY